MEMDPNPPSFNIPMSVQPMNIGADYAKGMEAGTAAGEQVGKGISAAFDVMTRNRTANDTLQAMNQSGILGDRAYQAVAGKSLGAKESMLGMYAGQWIAQQAQNRELQKLGYQGNVDIAVSHAKLLDTFALQRGKLPLQPNQQPNQQVPTPPKVQPAQQPLPGQIAYGGSASASVAPAPLTIGASIGAKEQVPQGARVGHVRGQPGIMMPDGVTFRPFQ